MTLVAVKAVKVVEDVVRLVEGGSISRNGWWMGDCPIHGRTSFNTIVDGCERCADENLVKNGLVKP